MKPLQTRGKLNRILFVFVEDRYFMTAYQPLRAVQPLESMLVVIQNCNLHESPRSVLKRALNWRYKNAWLEPCLSRICKQGHLWFQGSFAR